MTTRSRGWLVITLLVSVATSLFPAAAPDVPPASSLATGDFLWPKLPNKVVLYNSEPGAATDITQRQWEAERSAELKRLEKLSKPTEEDKNRYTALSQMTYEAFATQYLAGKPAGSVMPLGAIAPVATGHVAIVDVRGGVPWVIEAMLRDGVREVTYAAWLKGRPGEHVWQGRLIDATPAETKRLVDVARSELKKRYDFWNFDLSNENGFYCSKLAWFSVWKATGRSLDKDNNPRRALWYSPKQMLHSPFIRIISSPGPY